PLLSSPSRLALRPYTSRAACWHTASNIDTGRPAGIRPRTASLCYSPCTEGLSYAHRYIPARRSAVPCTSQGRGVHTHGREVTYEWRSLTESRFLDPRLVADARSGRASEADLITFWIARARGRGIARQVNGDILAARRRESAGPLIDPVRGEQ